MRCTECGSEVAENDVICRSCGAEIIFTANDVINDNAVNENENIKETARSTKKKSSAKNRKDGKNKRALAVGIAAVLIAAVLITIIIICIVSAVKSGEGRRLFDKVPLGRDVEKVSADTETDFIPGESSAYGALNYIADYDYICESEEDADVGGIKVPQWAVMLDEDGTGNITKVTLYSFGVLKHNWMGVKLSEKFETSSIDFGMKYKEAERKLGLKPYAVVKDSNSNTETYTYRYHYTDTESGNNCVMNFCMVVSDVDGQVKDVSEEKLDYLNLILSGIS